MLKIPTVCDEISTRLFFTSSTRIGRSRNVLAEGNTQIVYYAILEAAFNIVAINGPSLWYLVAGVPPERVLHSIRSIISLGSGHRPDSSKSSVERTTCDAAPGHKLDDTDSSPSIPVKNGVETYAMADLSAVTSTKGGQGVIVVDREFRREVEQRHQHL